VLSSAVILAEGNKKGQIALALSLLHSAKALVCDEKFSVNVDVPRTVLVLLNENGAAGQQHYCNDNDRPLHNIAQIVHFVSFVLIDWGWPLDHPSD
jgi:hypothetical protein